MMIMNPTNKLAFGVTSADRQSAPGQARDTRMKKLQPLNETINGLQVYGNEDGQRFTVRTVKHERGVESPAYHVEIKAVTDAGNPQVMVGTVLSDYCTLFIQRIRRAGLDEAPHEYGFFPVLLDQLQKLARDTGKQFVSILPDQDQPREYCARHGFQGDEGKTGHMRLRLEL